MFITLELVSNVSKHVALQSNQNGLWQPAQNINTLIGVTLEDAVQDPDTFKWYAPVCISGQDVYLIADVDIPDEGGFLHIRNDGKAYVDNSTIGCGIVAPRNIGEPARTAGSLIFAHLR